MLKVLPLPDELARGHIGRIRAINDLDDYYACIHAIRASLFPGCRNTTGLNVLDAVAMWCGFPMDQYAKRHTMLLFSTPFATPVESTDTLFWTPAIVKRMSLAATRARTCLCPSCVEEDLAFWGFSYWRRTHQIPGVHRCSKHLSPLRYVVNKNALDFTPNHWLANCDSSSLGTDTETLNHPIVERYNQIAADLLNRPAPYPKREFKKAISQKGGELGFRTGYCGSAPLISQHIRTVVPLAWLEELFPRMRDKRSGDYFTSLDYTLRLHGAAPAAAYCLVLATMFDSTEEALRHLDTPPLTNSRRKQEGVTSLFHKHQGNVDLIAKDLNTSPERVTTILRHTRSTLLRTLAGTPEMDAFAHFANGYSLSEACALSGANLKLVDQLLRLHLPTQFASIPADSPQAVNHPIAC